MRRLISAFIVVAALAAFTVVAQPSQGARQAHFTAAGDFGARSSTTSVLKAMAAAKPSATLALGDLKYSDKPTENDWCSYVKGIVGNSSPFQLLSGNHESLDGKDGKIEKFVQCLPNRVAGMKGIYGKQYWMDFPATSPLVRVIQVSPGLTFSDGRWAYKTGDPHYKWLAGAIDSGRKAGAKWIIVSAHFPCLSVGTYGCPNTDFHRLMLSKRVDLVLHGHEHAYMRTHQLTSGVSGCTTASIGSYDADCVQDRDSRFAAGAGTVFATVGTGGTPLRNVNMGDAEVGYFAAVSGANRNATYGYLDIAVDENSLTGRFVRTAAGSFSDAFTITRGTSTTTGTGTSTGGSTGSATSATLARDTFSRTISAGLGVAEVGGPWTIDGSSSGYNVDGSRGLMKLTPGTSRMARLGSVSTTTADTTLAISPSATPSGSGIYVSALGRVMPDRAAYRAKVWVSSSGVAQLRLTRTTSSGAETTVATSASTLSGVTANRTLLVRTRVSGTAPTTLQARMWLAGSPEPTSWQVQATDSTSGLQASGGVGIHAYESSKATSPITVRIDDLSVRR